MSDFTSVSDTGQVAITVLYNQGGYGVLPYGATNLLTLIQTQWTDTQSK